MEQPNNHFIAFLTYVLSKLFSKRTAEKYPPWKTVHISDLHSKREAELVDFTRPFQFHSSSFEMIPLRRIIYTVNF